MHRLRRALLTPALAAAMALALVACGGGGGSEESSASTAPGTATTADDGSPSIPDFEPPKGEFVEVDGAQARFINLLVADGEGVDLDVYWGVSAETGEKAGTVAYGEVSDWMPIKVDENPLMEPSDGEQEVAVAFYRAGETEMDGLVQQDSENLDDGAMLTYTMGTTKAFDSTVIPSSLGIGYEHEAGEAPDGQAWVALSTIGVGGIEGGDFMSLNSPDGCQDLTGTDIEGGTANAGEAYVLDPGTVELTASDANSDCAFKTPPVSLDLEAGDRYILYAKGTTLEDRELIAVKVGE